MSVRYVVCDRLLDPETNEHCEYDGYQEITHNGTYPNGYWRCPGCLTKHPAPPIPRAQLGSPISKEST